MIVVMYGSIAMVPNSSLLSFLQSPLRLFVAQKHEALHYSPVHQSLDMLLSSVSRLVNQLKRLGYVKSETSPDDRRGVLLSLTELGRQQTMDALNEKESVFYKRISKWEDSELEKFIQMLKLFNDNGSQ